MESDEELHFKSGLWGRAAKMFQAAGKWGDPYEETVVLPSLISCAALHLSDRHIIPGGYALSIFLTATVFAGFTLGVAWNFKRVFRVILRGIYVGLLTSFLTFALNLDFPGQQEAIRLGTIVTLAALAGYTAGFYLIGPFRDIALTTERQWQIGVERRRILYVGLRGVGTWISDVARMIVGTKKVEGATLPQGLCVQLFRWLVGPALAAYLAKSALDLRWSDFQVWWTQLRG